MHNKINKLIHLIEIRKLTARKAITLLDVYKTYNFQFLLFSLSYLYRKQLQQIMLYIEI